MALDLPPEVAARAVQSMGAQVTVSVSGSQVTELKRLRRQIAGGDADAIVAYSSDWARQSYPTIYEAALTSVSGGRHWLLVDQATGTVSRRGGLHTAATLVNLVAGCLHATRQTIAARRELSMGHIVAMRRIDAAGTQATVTSKWVLVIWIGSSSIEGGAITHLNGVLSGFRAHGYKTAIVTAHPLPSAVQAHVDRVVVTKPPPASHRFTRETAILSVDERITAEGRKLARQLRPTLVYQRHAYQCVAGLTVASEIGAPFVLEWNASEVWAKQTYWRADPLRRISRQFERLGEMREAQVVQSASLVAAVSQIVAQMAIAAGAGPEQVLTVPNAVDLADIPAPGPLPTRAPGALLGWVGSFGPWHGAEVAVRAVAHLPTAVRLLMIGDGATRHDCERLAVELEVGDRIEFCGSLPRREVLVRLQECDLLLSPHISQGDTPFFGSPTKLFEYMAIGRPIVASRLEQIADILDDGSTARLVSPGDDADLAKGVWEVLSTEDRGASLGRAARQEAQECHTWFQRVSCILEAL